MPLDIKDLNVFTHDKHIEISAHLGFQHLWYRIPIKFKPDELDATPFLVALLIPAMFLGEDIVVDSKYYISEKVFKNLDKLQDIYCCWNKSFSKVNVSATTKQLTNRSEKVGSFFSGGVDGSYTLLKHKEKIDFPILINGFDFGMGNRTWQSMFQRNQKFVEHYGKTLIPVETNFKTFILNFGLARVTNFGFQLISIAMLLGLKTTYLSAAATYSQIQPDGSHPLTDHLLNTESSSFIHTGLEADRFKKLAYLKQDKFAISNLWVCWRNPKRNCGNCSKCIRTYLALLLNGAPEAIEFQKEIDLKKLKRIKIKNNHDFVYFSNFLDIAEEKKLSDIATILKLKLFKYKAKQFLLDFDRYLFDKKLSSLKKNKYSISNLDVKVGLNFRYSDDFMRQRVLSLKSMDEITENNSIVGSVFFHDTSLDKDSKVEVPPT